MASFISRQINNPNDIINIHCLPLLNHQTNHVIITKRHAIEIYNINIDNTLTLRKSLPVWDTVLDSKPFAPLELSEMWLIVTTQSNKIQLVGFHNSTEEVVIEDYDLKSIISSLNIEPGTLTIDSQKHFSFYTQERSLAIFKLHKAKNLKNFERAFKSTVKNTPKLFEEPQFHSIIRFDKGIDRTPMNIIKIENHYEEGLSCSYSIIYRDDVYQYYCTFITLTTRDVLKYGKTLPLPEEVASILIPFEKNLGVFIFGKSTMFLRFYEPIVNEVSLDEKLQNAKDTTINIIDDDLGSTKYASKSLFGKTWKVTAAVELKRKNQGNLSKILIVTAKNELYLSEIHYYLNYNEMSVLKIEINKWSLKKFHNKIVSASHIVQVNENLFMLSSPRDGLRIIEIDWFTFSFKTLFEKTHTPPILDFNFTGTATPKVQVVGGNDLDSGLIRTEFKGYESKLKKIFSIEDSGITNFWKLGDVYAISNFNGTQFLKDNGLEIADFYPLNSISGTIIDIKINDANEPLVITETGIYQGSQLLKQMKISNGIILDSWFIYVTDNILKVKDESYKLNEEVSSISAIRYKKSIQVLIGTWGGSVILFVNGLKKVIQKKNAVIKSVIIKNVNNRLVYLVGDGHGQLSFINQDFSITDLNLGYSPVDVVDYTINAFIAYNAENTILFEIDNDEIKNKGYLRIDSPEIIKSYNQQLLHLKNQQISQLNITSENKLLKHEQQLNRLVRKSIKFKNHLELSIFVTISEKINKMTGKMVIFSQLEVIDNNTFKPRFLFKFDPGIEVTDIVNTGYRKDLIDIYEEESIQLGFENVLSQCFVVSCVPQSKDEVIAPLMLFTIDENGKLKYECSSAHAKATFYSLSSHVNRLVVGAGSTVATYKIVYSVTNSKFALNRVSEYYKSRYFVSTVKSIGPDVLIGDVIQGARILKLKVKKDSADGLIFKFQEENTKMEKSYFLTAMEVFKNLVIIADSLENISIQLLTNEGVESVSRFNLGDKVNVIKKINNVDEGLNEEAICKLFSEGLNLENNVTLPKIIPLFVIGTISGAIHIMSIITDRILLLKFKENNLLKDIKPLTKDFNEENLISLYADYRGFKTSTNFTSRVIERYIDGDLTQSHNDNELKIYIQDDCKLV